MKNKTSRWPARMKKWGGMAAGLMVGAVFGFVSVLLCEWCMGGQAGPLAMLALIGFMAAGILIHFILHEGGHWFFGRLTGYTLVSFRVGSLTLVNQNGCLSVKRFSLAGTGGQCLMAPPQTAPEQTPYFWYNLGGGAFNLIFALLALAPVWACRRAAPYAALFLMVFALCGAVVGLSNLIPMRAGGLANDGENARTLGKDPYSRRLFWIQLQVNALATQGMRLGQMQAQWFDLPENPDYTNSMVAAVAGMRVSRLIDLGQEQEAAALADQMLACPGLLGLLSLEARCERLYLAVMAGDTQKQRALETPELEKYIRAGSTMPARHRLAYARAMARGDAQQARQHLQRFEKTVRSYPVAGEIATEQALMARIDARFIKQQDPVPTDC